MATLERKNSLIDEKNQTQLGHLPRPVGLSRDNREERRDGWKREERREGER